MFYVGTYTGGLSEGIYLIDMDSETGALSSRGLMVKVPNPSFLTISKDRRHLFAVNEEGKGTVGSYAIQADGTLKPVNMRSTDGSYPCHISLAQAGKFVLVANYGSGNVVALRVERDGSLGEICAEAQHDGTGPNKQRQEAAHAHSFTQLPDGRSALACDLGTDSVYAYRLDGRNNMPDFRRSVRTQIAPGSGPRHLDFNRANSCVYVINELLSTITVLEVMPRTGEARTVMTTTTLPHDFEGQSTTADIHVHPSNKWLYGSNRGHDSIAQFEIARDGRLKRVEIVPTGGKTPRNFCIDPSGRFLLVGNQDSDSVATFRIDQETGKLTPTGYAVEIGKPVCIKFYR